MEIFETPLITKDKYIRYIKVSLPEIPPVLEGKILFPNGMSVNCKSTRMKLLWVHKNLVCEFCGIAAKYAWVEAHIATPEQTHLNFYGIDAGGQEVLLTWDHVEPKSLGGSNSLTNAQCLCTICNSIKGNDLPNGSDVTKIRKQKGLPIHYTYLADGSVVYKWTKHNFTSSLTGEVFSKK